MSNYITKDSGKRAHFESGMQRDTEDNKERYDLLYLPLLKEWAAIMARGAQKYEDDNWKKANSVEELRRFKASAWRHFVQFIDGEEDEAHHAAVLFNIGGCMYMMDKLNVDINGNPRTKLCEMCKKPATEPVDTPLYLCGTDCFEQYNEKEE